MRLPILSPMLAALAPVPALVLAWALLAPQAAEAQTAVQTAAKLTLTVTDIADMKGALMIALFDEAGYDKDTSVAAQIVPVGAATASTTFDGLKPGTYAIKMFHDVDGDGKMGMNPFGMPIEPYAFSNNAKGQFGPATWKAAAFDVGAAGASQSIKLN